MAGGIRFKKGSMARMKKAVSDKADAIHDEMIAKARAGYMGRWMAELGISDMKDFDPTSNPAVHIEWLLTDPANRVLAKKHPDEWLAMLTEEEREVYFRKDENGDSYSDVTKLNDLNPVTAAKQLREAKKRGYR